MSTPPVSRIRPGRHRPAALVAAVAAMTALGACAGGAAHATGPVGFTSPTRNVVCGILTGNPAGVSNAVRCDIAEFTYPSPPRPPDCSHDIGHTVGLTEGQPPGFGCAHDTIAYSGFPVLNYGDSLQSGPFRCEMSERGVTCSDTGSGHSFRLSRESYEFR